MRQVSATLPFAISFMSANYVAKELGLRRADRVGHRSTTRRTRRSSRSKPSRPVRRAPRLDPRDRVRHHRPLVRASNWRWATPNALRAAPREALARHGVSVVSLAGGVGATTDCGGGVPPGDIPTSTSSPVWARSCTPDRAGAAAVLPAAAPAAASRSRTIRRRLRRRCCSAQGDQRSERLGAAVDTGWWATPGISDPVAAVEELSERLFHVHLKDVEAPGTHCGAVHAAGRGLRREHQRLDKLLFNRLLGGR